MNRPTLSFDGCGINGPDEYRTRLATFTSSAAAKEWGPLFEAAPDLLAACERAEIDLRDFTDPRGEYKPSTAGLLAIARELAVAIAKAKGGAQ